MTAQKVTFIQEPPLIMDEGKTILVNFGMEKKEETYETTDAKGEAVEQMRTIYEGYSIRIAQPLSRDKVIDAIVSAAYPNDRMQAIMNNHALDEADDEDYEEHLAEWKAMQEWRRTAKTVAKEVIETIANK